jgi:hypothetical protein
MLSIGWPKIGTSWVTWYYGQSIQTSSTTSWISCDTYVVTTTCYLDYVISTTSSTCSTWMLSIT